MKKTTTLLLGILFIVISISSCEKEVDLTGTYNGNTVTNKPMTIHASSEVNIVDTTITTLDSKLVIQKTDDEKILELTIELKMGSTPFNIKEVPADKISDSEIKITDFTYEYLGSIPILVNGSAKLDKDGKLKANIILSNAGNAISNTEFDGDLTFTGTK